MNFATAQRLITLNHSFYTNHGLDFAETRLRLQPGVQRVLASLHGDERILDLGSGNGEMARVLSRQGHHGSYLGLDFSDPLLFEAQRQAFSFPVRFQKADLSKFAEISDQFLNGNTWSVVTAFAFLHHIPGQEIRLALIKKTCQLLESQGLLIISNWQFLNSPRLKARIQPWDSLGLTVEDVDSNDYLIDWKRGGTGLRYVHHFDQAELELLASAAGFEIVQTFYSDGENGKLGLYQTWKKT